MIVDPSKDIIGCLKKPASFCKALGIYLNNGWLLKGGGGGMAKI